MSVERFLIAPLKSGLQSNVEPWLIMDNAWEILDNAHVWRGRLRKRFGAYSMNNSKADAEKQLFSRFRINIGTTNGAGALVVAAVPGALFKVGQIFSCGAEIYTVNTLGNPAALLSTGAGTATYDTTTGAFNLVGAPIATDVYFYPSDPVMALPTYDRADINDEDLFGFDTQFAYTFTKATGWQLAGSVPAAPGSGLWTGTDSDFHWTTNYRGAQGDEFLLFVVNGVVADQIQYWDNVNWTKFAPVYNTTTGFVIQTAKIVIPFKDRLLLMNTTEQTAAGNVTFVNRIRFSQNGDPTTAATAWDEVVVGRGGFIEAPTREAIISSQFIKDRLIIFFERSTWELVYTGNEVLPFRFQKLNPDLGVESQNSVIPFDKVTLGMGSTGVHACNGMNVDRIDKAIPDEVFDILNKNSGPQRVSAIKEYFTEEVYWSYPSAEQSGPQSEKFPNRLLVYNYLTGNWAIYDDSITAFGYYQHEGDLTWADLDDQWLASSDRWNDPSLQSLFRNVVAGNQQGFTFIVDIDKGDNAFSLSITDIAVAANEVTLTVIDHNLDVGDFVYLDNIESDNNLEDLNEAILRVEAVPSSDTFTVQAIGVAGVYEGGGTIKLVSQVFIKSKRYNFFNKVGKRIQVPRIDFLVDTTEDGEISFDFFSSFSDVSLSDEGNVSGANLGSNILETQPLSHFEETQIKVWRSVYPLLEGDTIQYSLALTDEQMKFPRVAFSDFQLHAVLFFARATDDFGF